MSMDIERSRDIVKEENHYDLVLAQMRMREREVSIRTLFRI